MVTKQIKRCLYQEGVLGGQRTSQQQQQQMASYQPLSTAVPQQPYTTVPTIPPQVNATANTASKQRIITAARPPSEQAISQSHPCSEDLYSQKVISPVSESQDGYLQSTGVNPELVEITTSPVTESSQGYWNFPGIKPNLPENVTFNIFSAFIIYANEENDPNGDRVLYLSDFLRHCGVDCNIDQYYRNNVIADWSHWVSQSIQYCVAQNGHIILVCSAAMFALLEDTDDNVRVNMATGHIDRLTLRNLLQQHTKHFLPLCIDDTSTSYIPPSLRGKTVYHFPFNMLPQNSTAQQILDLPDFASVRMLIATLTEQQEIPVPNVTGSASKATSPKDTASSVNGSHDPVTTEHPRLITFGGKGPISSDTDSGGTPSQPTKVVKPVPPPPEPVPPEPVPSQFVKPAPTLSDSVSDEDSLITDSKRCMRLMRICVIPKISEEWEAVAAYLDYSKQAKDDIKKDYETPRECCTALLEDWVTTDNGVKPKTWKNFIEVLSDIEELESVIEDIKQCLISVALDEIAAHKQNEPHQNLEDQQSNNELHQSLGDQSTDDPTDVVEVKFDYDAQQPDELTLRVGDIIRNCKLVEDGWMEGELNGKRGIFPDNYVEITPPPDMVVKFQYDAEQPDELTLRVGDIIKNCKVVEDGWMKGELNGKWGIFPDNYVVKKKIAPPPDTAAKKTAKVMFDYEAAQPDELTIKVDDIVEVVSEEEPGWIKVKLGDKIGIIPEDFIEIIKKEPPKLPTPPLPSREKPPPVSRSPPPEKKEEPVKRLPIGVPLPGPSNTAAKKTAKVMFDYEAAQPDELTIKVNDIVEVVSEEESGWVKVKLGDKIGIIPEDFIEIIKKEPPKLPIPPLPSPEELPPVSTPPPPEKKKDPVKRPPIGIPLPGEPRPTDPPPILQPEQSAVLLLPEHDPPAGTDKPTIRLLNNHVRDRVAPKWRDLGIELLNDVERLNIIEQDHRDVETCCTEMFKYWLNVDIEASWNKLIEALKVIHENALAEKLKTDVIKETDNNDGGDQPDDKSDDGESDDHSNGSIEDPPKADVIDVINESDQLEDTSSHHHNAAQTLLGGMTWTALTCSAGVIGYVIGGDVGVFTGALCTTVTGVLCIDVIQWCSTNNR